MFDESPLFRAGVAHVLNADSGLQVVAVSHTCQLGTVPPPDVVVLDAKMMMSEIGAARSAYAFRSWPKVLILALSLDEEQFLAAFAAGAKGYLLKGASERQLLEAVYAVHRGEGYVSPEVAATMFTRCGLKKCGRGLNASLTDQLSHREGEIFKLLPTGLTNREIGRRLGVTENTVKRYFTRIFEKLHVRNRVEAAMLSRRELKAKALQEGKPILGLAALVSILNFDAGDQIIINGLGGDDVVEASGLQAGIQLVANGGDGDDILIGSPGNDILAGGAGDDVLVGGGGQDVVDGGPGDNVVIQSLTAPLDPFIM